jgi:hypothetical protein
MKIVTTLLIWIAAHSSWEVPEDRPQISFEPTEFIEQAVGKDYLAAYRKTDDLIILSDQFDKTDVKDQAILMHEIVHWLQDNYPYRTYRCDGVWEIEAYDLTELYLEQRGQERWWHPFAAYADAMCHPALD